MAGQKTGPKNEMHLGEGSEWHLLRFLGRHRQCLNRAIEEAVPGSKMLSWLDFPFNQTAKLGDAEWTGVGFLDEQDDAVKTAWREFWPQTGSAQHWDAVGKIQIAGKKHWLLVEAKAHLDELASRCGATSENGVAMIGAAFTATKKAMDVDPLRDWCKPYYQYANRLAALHFLRSQGILARMVFIYFVGDCLPGRNSPQTTNEWSHALKAVDDHLGLTGQSELEKSVHRVFIPVSDRCG